MMATPIAPPGLDDDKFDPSRYGGPGVWGNSVGSLGPKAPWQIKNTFLHVNSASNEDFSNIRKVKSANDMAMRFTGIARQEDSDDELSIPSQNEMYVDDEDDEVAHEPGTNGFNGLSNGLHKPVTVTPAYVPQPKEPSRNLGQVRNVSFSQMPVVAEEDEPEEKKETREVNFESMMIRNIPNRYSQQMLLSEIDKAGFKGKYNFFYLPIDFGQRANLGYAFISFNDVTIASQFVSTFEGEKLRKFKSRKILSISPAVYQGLAANLNHFAKAALQRIANPRFQPKVFVQGEPVAFEAAYTNLLTQFTGVRVR
jgi:hypothetical protein